ncbi:MAG: 3-deoxy-8-phosphooctulonate synthase [Candidatus Omnitrophica bacterium]|nr:3-deoxy-8-phosphooctulonate synthase [Candidatus Omnitrophota bacterium]
MARPIRIGKARIGRGCPLMLVAGPCVIESAKSALEHARAISRIVKPLGIPWIFKASYDKANRSSVGSFRGPGLEAGLAILRRIRKETGVSILSDVHTAAEATAAGEVLDVIQIPAFLCRQTDLLVAAGKTGCVVNIKKGQFMSPEAMRQAVDKVRSTGNERIVLTERGTFFGYGRLVNDFRSVQVMREMGCPVIFDATHSVQEPGALGHTSGGDRRAAPLLAACAVAAGADGVFVEVHRSPAKALCDGPNSLALSTLGAFLKRLQRIYEAVQHD